MSDYAIPIARPSPSPAAEVSGIVAEVQSITGGLATDVARLRQVF